MSPTIHCVRHAQGYHNLSVANHQLPDPLLTPYGEEQCRAFQTAFPSMKNVDLVVASPLKRTIYTALMGFDPAIKEKNLKVIALPELQETSDLPCDTGSSSEDIAKEFAGKPIDLGLVKDGWNSKRMRWAPTATAIEKRARDARLWLMARPEKEIVVVTHGGFLHYFTEDWSDSHRLQGTGWANTEFRSYEFSTSQPDEAHLVESVASKQRRHGEAKPLDHNETTQLKRTTTSEMEKKSKEYLEQQRKEAQATAALRKVQGVQAKIKANRRDDITEGYSFL